MLTETGKKNLVAAVDKYVDLIQSRVKKYREDLRTSLTTHTFPKKFVEVFQSELEAQRVEDEKEALIKEQKAQRLEAEQAASKLLIAFQEADAMGRAEERLEDINAEIAKYEQLKLDSANNFELGTAPVGSLSYQEKSKSAEEHRDYFRSEKKTFEHHFYIELSPLIESLYSYEPKTKSWSYSDLAADNLIIVTTKMHWAKEYRTAERILKNLAAEKVKVEKELYESNLVSALSEDSRELLGKHLEQFTKQQAKLAVMYDFDKFPPGDKKYVYDRLISGLKAAFASDRKLQPAFEVFDREQARRDDLEQRKQAIIKILDEKYISLGNSSESKKWSVKNLQESVSKFQVDGESTLAGLEQIIIGWQKYENFGKQNDKLFRSSGFFNKKHQENFVDQCRKIAQGQVLDKAPEVNPDDDNDVAREGMQSTM